MSSRDMSEKERQQRITLQIFFFQFNDFFKQKLMRQRGEQERQQRITLHFFFPTKLTAAGGAEEGGAITYAVPKKN
jgi:hypothetical protein